MIKNIIRHDYFKLSNKLKIFNDFLSELIYLYFIFIG